MSNPVAYITGYYKGHCVIEPVDPAVVLPVNMALYSAPAHEREKVAQWMMKQGYATGHGNTVEELLKELDWQIREQEREACAKLIESKKSGANELTDLVRDMEAQAIRERGKQ